MSTPVESPVTVVPPRPSPMPWFTDNKTVPMPQEEGADRHAVYLWAAADDRLVAVIMGDTEAEAKANAKLMVDLSRAMATARAAKENEWPMPGDKLRILVDEPSSAELNRGDVVLVVADPDENSSMQVGEASIWVQDPGSTQWALDPTTRGIDWVVIPRGV